MSEMKRKFAAFDIDGTIFRWQLYHELFDALCAAKIIEPDEMKRVLAARTSWNERQISFRDYEIILVEIMEQAIQGQPEHIIHTMAKEILTHKGKRVYAYTRNLIAHLKQQGYFTVAISGSHQQLVEPFARLYGIDIAYGAKYEILDGVFGKSQGPVLGQKGSILQQLVEEYELTWDESYAVGDSGGDAGMLELVNHPIAFNPDEKLYKIAREHNWKIVIERKSMIYELEPQKGNDGTYILAQTNVR